VWREATYFDKEHKNEQEGARELHTYLVELLDEAGDVPNNGEVAIHSPERQLKGSWHCLLRA